MPIGILAGLSAVRVLDADRGTGLQGGADWLEALLVTAGLMLSTRSSEPPGTVVGTTRYGWESARTFLAAALAVAPLAAFLTRQATARTPLLPLRIFSVRDITGQASPSSW